MASLLAGLALLRGQTMIKPTTCLPVPLPLLPDHHIPSTPSITLPATGPGVRGPTPSLSIFLVCLRQRPTNVFYILLNPFYAPATETLSVSPHYSLMFSH